MHPFIRPHFSVKISLLILSMIGSSFMLVAQNDPFALPSDTAAIDSSLLKQTIDSAVLDRTFDKITLLSYPWLSTSEAIDTSIDLLHRYLPNQEATYRRGDLGNTGSPTFDYVYNPILDIGFQTGYNQYKAYFTQIDDISISSTPFPVTRLSYTQGSGTEQTFNATHAQNVQGKTLFGAQYKILAAKGNYTSERARIQDIYAYVASKTKNNKYHFLAVFQNQEAKNEINGGTDFQNLFDQNIRPGVVPINLNSANAKWTNNQFTIRQHYDIGGSYEIEVDDTTCFDAFYPTLQLTHELRLINEQYNYWDKNPIGSFYGIRNIFTDAFTADKLSATTIENAFGLVFTGIHKQTPDSTYRLPFQFDAYLVQGQHTVNRFPYAPSFGIDSALVFTKTQMGSTRIEGRFATHRPIANRLSLSADAAFHIAGAFIGDFKVNALGTLHTGKGDVNAKFTTLLQSPTYIDEQYLSNHVLYQIDLKNRASLNFGLDYTLPALNLTIGAERYFLNQVIYRNSDIVPAQETGLSSVDQVWIQHHLTLKNLHWKHYGLFQSTSTSAIPLPSFVVQSRLYYENDFFKQATRGQIGIEMNYISSFDVPEYHEPTGQFLVQTSPTSYSTPPIFDVFVNFKVQRARIFFLLKDAASGLGFPNGYYINSTYPAQQRGFYFGVDWAFFN